MMTLWGLLPMKDNILGINYSGFHDTSVAVVRRDGVVLYASSLERESRIKQDGRPPFKIQELISQFGITQLAASTNEFMGLENPIQSKIFSPSLPIPRTTPFKHSETFNEFFSSFGIPVNFVEHQRSHALSSVVWSGFDEGICFTYDGGMCNSTNFGGLFRFSKSGGLSSIDGFDYRLYPKITSLYSCVTAILGFKPNRHEGKVTGLAALGRIQQSILEILSVWFTDRFLDLESIIRWYFSYSSTSIPKLIPIPNLIEQFRNELETFSKADIAASLQFFTQEHIKLLLSNAQAKGIISGKENLCLAGGLFSNVKLNQEINNFGFRDVFVAPAMTDDGTALGAAWGCIELDNLQHASPISAYLGNSSTHTQVLDSISKFGLKISTPSESLEYFIAKALVDGKVICNYQGKSEFGPRALGNRTILASAESIEINQEINSKLNRTEFMPFAPVIMECDFSEYFEGDFKASYSYMTMTANATSKLQLVAPAVVHADNTARPQVLSQVQNPFLYRILQNYKEMTGNGVLINTSFNVHEEPIVDSAEDAIQNFLLAQLDFLVLNNKFVIDLCENSEPLISFLTQRLHNRFNSFENELSAYLLSEVSKKDSELVEKELVIQTLLKRLPK
jgi:carbamoyltransferase